MQGEDEATLNISSVIAKSQEPLTWMQLARVKKKDRTVPPVPMATKKPSTHVIPRRESSETDPLKRLTSRLVRDAPVKLATLTATSTLKDAMSTAVFMATMMKIGMASE